MRKRLEYTKDYSFAWLDEVTELILNPRRGNADQLQVDELNRLQNQFETEVWEAMANLKAQTFWIYSTKKESRAGTICTGDPAIAKRNT